MRLLVLDCAANACAAGVIDGEAVLAARSEPMTRGHAERIAPMLADCLADASITAGDLNAVAVTIGPGAFTGIRIGLAAARGFALAAELPILGVSCLEVAALPFRDQGPVLVALETKRADFYLQAFDRNGTAMTDPAAVMQEDLNGFLPSGIFDNNGWPVTGDGATRLVAAARETLPALHEVTASAPNSAVAAGCIALARVAENGLPVPGDAGPRPLYLRPPDVNLKPSVSPLGKSDPTATGPGHGKH